jgi:amino acid transporter
VSSTAPAYSIAVSLIALAAAVQLHMPAAMIVGFIPVFGIAVGFYHMNRHEPNAGASYTWVGKAIHPLLGYLNGWVILLIDLIFLAFAAPIAGNATLQLLNNINSGSGWWVGTPWDATNTTSQAVVGVIWLAIVTYMCLVGIKLAARFQWVLLALEYFIVVGFSILGFIKGGGSGFSADWFNPFSIGSLSTVAAGVVVAVFLYWGWDTAANISEES